MDTVGNGEWNEEAWKAEIPHANSFRNVFPRTLGCGLLSQLVLLLLPLATR